MMREEWWKDIRSLDAEKMTPIQTSTGSQYFTNDRNFGTADGSRVARKGARKTRKQKAEMEKKSDLGGLIAVAERARGES